MHENTSVSDNRAKIRMQRGKRSPGERASAMGAAGQEQPADDVSSLPTFVSVHQLPLTRARRCQMQIVALPAGVQALPSARKSEMQRTTTPKVAQATAGSFEREYHGSCGAESLM